MASKRPSVQKRNNELAKREKRLAKAAKRAAREARKAEAAETVVEDGIDPDLVGIQAGPQPPREDELLDI